jgi:hypothetical protein
MRSVTIVNFISRCLAILAVVGLLAVQTSSPAAAKAVGAPDAGASTTAMVMDGMPVAMTGMHHCPDTERAPPPDCGKGCPWAVLCMASWVDDARTPDLAAAASRRVAALAPTDDPVVPPWSDGPPARPPRA